MPKPKTSDVETQRWEQTITKMKLTKPLHKFGIELLRSLDEINIMCDDTKFHKSDIHDIMDLIKYYSENGGSGKGFTEEEFTNMVGDLNFTPEQMESLCSKMFAWERMKSKLAEMSATTKIKNMIKRIFDKRRSLIEANCTDIFSKNKIQSIALEATNYSRNRPSIDSSNMYFDGRITAHLARHLDLSRNEWQEIMTKHINRDETERILELLFEEKEDKLLVKMLNPLHGMKSKHLIKPSQIKRKLEKAMIKVYHEMHDDVSEADAKDIVVTHRKVHISKESIKMLTDHTSAVMKNIITAAGKCTDTRAKSVADDIYDKCKRGVSYVRPVYPTMKPKDIAQACMIREMDNFVLGNLDKVEYIRNMRKHNYIMPQDLS